MTDDREHAQQATTPEPELLTAEAAAKRGAFSPLAAASLAALLVAVIVYVIVYSLPRGSTVPQWGAPASNIAQHASDGGLVVLPEEGVAEHIHSHLSITFDGKAVTVPALIGIDESKRQYSEIHTHDTSGILHVESAKPRPFYLGQVFDEWNVELKPHGVGGYNDGAWGVRVAAFVNGKPYAGSLRWLELKNKQDIVIAITTNGDVPQDTPAFKWPRGY